jgi:PAT family beta-lactamase induction signal transducer AmpG
LTKFSFPVRPNLLASRTGRLVAFFLLYVTEGIPLGFAATAVATQLRRSGVGPAEIGAFVGLFYLPWAFKWALGPIIDVFGWRRMGHRRGWIVLAQVMMSATLLSTVLLKLPEQMGLFTAILLVHNVFGAMQDVAIDALACNTLKKEERGLANGMMFSGAYIGQMLGGGGVLLLSGYVPFAVTFYFVTGTILAVTLVVLLLMREPPMPERDIGEGSRLKVALGEMHAFSVNAFRSFFGTRGAFAGVFFSLLPPGAMCLGLALQSSLAVELGMDDDEVGRLNVASTITSALFCVLGGFLSDRLGRRKTLFAYVTLMGLPVLYMMTVLVKHGWFLPINPVTDARWPVPQELFTALWVASIVYAAFQGLMYGTRSAIMMDVTNPAVAGTQFTAYMALANVAISYSAVWQGKVAERWGYPATMMADVVVGLVCLGLIPLLKPTRRSGAPAPVSTAQEESPPMPEGTMFLDGGAARRARFAAALLGMACLASAPAWSLFGADQSVEPILTTLSALVFVASALFLLAGGAVLRTSAPILSRVVTVVALALLVTAGRRYVWMLLNAVGLGLPEQVPAMVNDVLLLLVPPIGGVVLLVVAGRSWNELTTGHVADGNAGPGAPTST